MAKFKKIDEDEIQYTFPLAEGHLKISKYDAFKKYLYNSEDGTVLDRNLKSWFQITLFYTIHFSILAGVFAICMKGLFVSLDPVIPKYTLEESIIGTNPGVSFRPMAIRPEEGAVIWYDARNHTQVKKWTQILDDYLKGYFEEHPNQVQCDFGQPPPFGKVCAVNYKAWDPCIPSKNYSYSNESPCIYVKINKIYGWIPEVYDDPEDLPEDMPADLQEYIHGLPADERRQIWISCHGNSLIDREMISSHNIKFISGRGLPEYYFPYMNTPGYLPPLVVVQLQRIPRHRSINIECRAWAKNIHYHGGQRDRQGSTVLSLLID